MLKFFLEVIKCHFYKIINSDLKGLKNFKDPFVIILLESFIYLLKYMCLVIYYEL